MTTPQIETNKTQPASTASSAASANPPKEAVGAEAEVAESPVPSKYIKFSDGSRTLADAVATVTVNREKLFVKDRGGDFLIVLEFDQEEDAQAEMECVNAQLDLHEAARAARPLRRSAWRGARRR